MPGIESREVEGWLNGVPVGAGVTGGVQGSKKYELYNLTTGKNYNQDKVGSVA